MNIFAGLETFLYIISSALFYPVVAGLVLLIFWMVISFGGFLREFVDRMQGISLPFRRYQRMLECECKDKAKGNIDINLERLLQAAELDLVIKKVTDKKLNGEGTRLGTAYQLNDGKVVYVPE